MGNVPEDIAREMVAEDHATPKRRPRVLCLHGFRTSGAIMREQVKGKWPRSVTDRLGLFFPDAPYPAEGKSDVEGIFPPPYYEWFQVNKETWEYRNVDRCLEFIENYMLEHGPFDGLLGFSRGATLSAALAGMQAKGLALTRVPKIKFLVIIGGGMLMSPDLQSKAYSDKIVCLSLHLIGEMDYMKSQSEALLESCSRPLVISHPKGHTVPRLDEKGLETMNMFLDFIERDLDVDNIQQDHTAEK